MTDQKTTEELPLEIQATENLAVLFNETILHFQKRLRSNKKPITASELKELRGLFKDLGVTDDLAKVLKNHINFRERSQELKHVAIRKPEFGNYLDDLTLPFPGSSDEEGKNG